MRRDIAITVLVLVTCAASALASESAPRLELEPGRADALYSVDQTVTFHVSVLKDDTPVDNGEIAFVFTKDRFSPLGSQTLPVTGQPVAVETKLDEPGFIRCRASYAGKDGVKLSAEATVGVDPLNIKPSLASPEDFDEFWAEKKAALAQVPLNAMVEPAPCKMATVKAFNITVDCIGKPVQGCLAFPADAKPKSLPALVIFQAAGVAPVNSDLFPEYAGLGVLVIWTNAHGMPNDQPAEYYQKLKKTDLQDYPHQGREDREACYFLGMYLRVQRTLDFLVSQPEWNERDLMVAGFSQGGGQAIVAAGLDPRVTGLMAHEPAMCDHTGFAVGRTSGWPRLVAVGKDGPRQDMFKTARYFDAMNFAARCKAEAVFTAGFLDSTCPPTSVYAAYNNLRGPKQIQNLINGQHSYRGWPNDQLRRLIGREKDE